MLYLYNSVAGQKQEFVPLERDLVRMYACGPTVYDRIHVGNARPIVVFDLLFRLLNHMYENVVYVRNITDIDDKIIDRAFAKNETVSYVTDLNITLFHQDIDNLFTLRPSYEPRATQYINEMIAMIGLLLANGAAYISEGNVIFDISKDVRYGSLSKRLLDDLIAGARVETADYKRHHGDFVLWKPAKENETEHCFDSPWGRGRPGWHIECSVMSYELLGKEFDIHCGGHDLMFPHHENEIAQTRMAHGIDLMARFWLHNGMITVNGAKMSKSLGNFLTLADALKKYNGETIRYFLMSSHYRQSLDWTDSGLIAAKHALDSLYRLLEQGDGDVSPMLDVLANDLNTPRALSLLHGMRGIDLYTCGRFLGLFNYDPTDWFHVQCDDIEAIEALIEERKVARLQQDFAKSDEIRDSLLSRYSVILEDNSDGRTTWHKK